jgi:hypothetical protein
MLIYSIFGTLLNTPIYVRGADVEPLVSPILIYLQILDNIVAFLAFMALKANQLKVSPKFLTLVDYN